METARLRLRQWTDADREPLARLNADPEVMRHFPAPLTRAESDAMLDRMRAHIDEKGWGFWAAEKREGGELAGIVGLVTVKDIMPFAPGVEVGWRLARAHWGQGYAAEGARVSLAHGFGPLKLQEIVSLTALTNTASQRVMERIGMRRAGTFDHPALPEGHALRPHCLYRITRSEWERSGAPAAFACGAFDARELAPAEMAQMQRFYDENPGYFRIVEGAPAARDAAWQDFVQWVPSGWVCRGKHVIAFRDREGRIVGVADVLFDLFSPGVWHIGLFLTAERLHGSGVPHALYAHLEAWMRSRGARWIRLGVVRDNARGARFWEKMGYIDVARREGVVYGSKSHTLRVMAKALAGGTLGEYRALVARDREPAEELENP